MIRGRDQDSASDSVVVEMGEMVFVLRFSCWAVVGSVTYSIYPSCFEASERRRSELHNV